MLNSKYKSSVTEKLFAYSCALVLALLWGFTQVQAAGGSGFQVHTGASKVIYSTWEPGHLPFHSERGLADTESVEGSQGFKDDFEHTPARQWKFIRYPEQTSPYLIEGFRHTVTGTGASLVILYHTWKIFH